MEKETLSDGILKDITQIVVETAEENPIAIATFTSDFIEVAQGYRVRMKPDYNNQCSLSTDEQGVLP